MNFKKLGVALVLLGLGLVVFGLLAQHQGGGVAHTQDVHVLTGTTTPAGNYAYAEDAPYYTIKVSYPATTSLAVPADAAARLVIETALAKEINQFKTDGNFANLTPEDVKIQGLGPDRKYALDMEYAAYASSDYVSYVYTIYEDTLGALPTSTI